jgi:hypothetical protein
VKLKEE